MPKSPFLKCRTLLDPGMGSHHAILVENQLDDLVQNHHSNLIYPIYVSIYTSTMDPMGLFFDDHSDLTIFAAARRAEAKVQRTGTSCRRRKVLRHHLLQQPLKLSQPKPSPPLLHQHRPRLRRHKLPWFQRQARRLK